MKFSAKDNFKDHWWPIISELTNNVNDSTPIMNPIKIEKYIIKINTNPISNYNLIKFSAGMTIAFEYQTGEPIELKILDIKQFINKFYSEIAKVTSENNLQLINKIQLGKFAEKIMEKYKFLSKEELREKITSKEFTKEIWVNVLFMAYFDYSQRIK